MSEHHPYLLSHHAEKLENVFIEEQKLFAPKLQIILSFCFAEKIWHIDGNFCI